MAAINAAPSPSATSNVVIAIVGIVGAVAVGAGGPKNPVIV